jgi:hypothetical protein
MSVPPELPWSNATDRAAICRVSAAPRVGLPRKCLWIFDHEDAKKIGFAAKNLHCLRPAIHLASQMGAGMGAGPILF